ncbi:MAG: 2-hydroxyacid dehydrogenase [Methyloligellaceae bacterium]
MTLKKPLVILTRRLPEVIETRMRELFNVKFNETDTPFTKDQLIKAVQEAEILVPTVTDKIDAAVLKEAGPQCRLIANFGNGVDNIDLDTALDLNITVTNTPGVLTEDTADMAMALLLAVPRRLAEGNLYLREHGQSWQGWSPTWMLGHRIHGKQLGIVGLGRIGRAIARRAKAFGIKIHYHNRHQLSSEKEEELGATYWESLDQMLARMDIISINCPRTPATYHLLSARRINLMKPEAYIVNTARGEVIDESALVEALETRHIAGAGLDVFEREPEINPKLLTLDNVVTLPHMGSATIEGRIDMGSKVIVNIKSFTDGHVPPDMVHPSMY